MTEFVAVQNAGGVWWLAQGPLANRPEPGMQNRLYAVVEPTGNFWTRDTGATWEVVGSSEAASSILTKLLAVDGTGCELDADLLDGLHASALQLRSEKGLANGYAELGSDSRHPAAQSRVKSVAGKENEVILVPSDVGAIAKAGDTNVVPFTLSRDPQQAMEPATMQYVDAARAGLDLKPSVRAATTGPLPAYSHAAGVLSASAAGALPAQDGVVLGAGERLAVKNEPSAPTDLRPFNGVYVVTDPGSASTPWRLTRAPDSDSGPEVTPNAFVFVEEGSSQADTGWSISTNGPISLGTTAITWTQFSGPGTVTAGTGLARSGNQLSVAPGGIGPTELAPTGVAAGSYNNASVTIDEDGRVTSIAAGAVSGYTATTHREGLNIVRVSANAITVTTGSAYIPTRNGILEVSTEITKTNLPAFPVNSWLYIYLFDNAGTPDFEISTVAPAAPYRGSARVRSGGTAADNARRYLGVMKSNAAGTLVPLRRHPGGHYDWMVEIGTEPTNLFINNGVGATASFSDLAPQKAMPATARRATLQAFAAAAFVAHYYSNSEGPTSGIGLRALTANAAWTPFELPLDANGVFSMRVNTTNSTGYSLSVHGFWEPS